jgi:4-amino-4-deoxy-L-arabinose transferase-like glycosyltransferase
MNKKHKLILILILGLGLFLRVWRLDKVPPSLNWDEVSIGYNAYSILKTGKDEWGQKLPLHFRAFGEYKLPVHIYLSIPGIKLLGLNEYGVRITPAVIGVLAVLGTYFLGKEIFKQEKYGLLAAFLLAVSPWHLQLTRASFESATAMCLLNWGLYFFLKGRRKPLNFSLSALFFGLSIYTYNAERAFIPLFGLALIFIFRKTIFKNFKKVIPAVLITLAFVGSLIPIALSSTGQSRYELVSFVSDPGFVLRINEARGKLNLPAPIPRAVHNKLTHFVWRFSQNYLAHYSPGFLFLNGAGHHQHHAQVMGELYLISAPFLLAGVWYLIKKGDKKIKLLFLAWIGLSAVPVAITNDSIPHALRELLVLPSYQLLTAFGFFNLIKQINKPKAKQLLIASASLLFLIQFGYYLNHYHNIYPKKYSRDWQYGYKQVVNYVDRHYDQYDRIIISRYYGEPHIFTLFWLKFPPADYQNDPNLVRYQSHDWVWVTQFDKFLFPDLYDKGTRVEDMKQKYQGQGKTLIVGRPADFPADDPVLKKVDFLNGEDAFQISEF